MTRDLDWWSGRLRCHVEYCNVCVSGIRRASVENLGHREMNVRKCLRRDCALAPNDCALCVGAFKRGMANLNRFGCEVDNPDLRQTSPGIHPRLDIPVISQ